MSKHVFHSSEVYHRWANQAADTWGKSRSGTMSFAGGVAFSYGTAIGQKQGGLTFVNPTKYSSTTAGHQYSLARAINTEVIYIYQHIARGERQVFCKDSLAFNHEEVEVELDLLVKLIGKQKRARTYDYSSQIESLKRNLQRFCEVSGHKCPDLSTPEVEIAKLNARRDRAIRKAEKQKRLEEAACVQQAAEVLAAWFTHTDVKQSAFLLRYLPHDHVRISPDGSEVETSRNVKVEVSKIKILLPLLTSILAGSVSPDRLVGRHIDGYTIDEIDLEAGIVRIGCHTFKISELLTELASLKSELVIA